MKVLSILLLLISVTAATASQSIYPFASSVQTQRFQHLLQEFRCVVCQNEVLADSNAGIAKDLRQQIYQQVLAHKTDDQIKAYLIARYGEFILFDPLFNAKTYLLWLLPWLLLLVGALLWWRNLNRATEKQSI